MLPVNNPIKPLLTVITVTRNAKDILQETIDSLNAQTFRDRIEYLIIDGASVDGTLDIIKANAHHVDGWISEPDGGIYDAMNKGIRLANGEWIHFLNAGDTFVDATTIQKVDLEHQGSALVYGDYHRIYPDGFLSYEKARPKDDIWKKMICSHQSLFAKTALLIEHPFETEYSICADFQFLQWAYTKGYEFTKLNFAVSEVLIERYTWPQLRRGIIQKWKASKATLKKPSTDFFYAKELLFVGAKHLLKKIIPLTRLKASK